MQKLSLDALAREHLERAAASATGRSAGTTLAEHDSPGEATVLVLRGRVTLRSGDDAWDGMTGDLLIVPPARHSLEAVEDTAVVLSVAKTA